MSRAHECSGAAGLSLLLRSWALDIKNAAPFYLERAERIKMKLIIKISVTIVALAVILFVDFSKIRIWTETSSQHIIELMEITNTLLLSIGVLLIGILWKE